MYLCQSLQGFILITVVIEALSQACTTQKLAVYATELQRNIFLQKKKHFFQLPYPQNRGWW